MDSGKFATQCYLVIIFAFAVEIKSRTRVLLSILLTSLEEKREALEEFESRDHRTLAEQEHVLT